MDAIVADQSRLRENMKALKGSAEEKALLQRYTKQLDEQEDHLAALKKEIGTQRERKQQLNGELACLIEGITLDAAM